MDLQQQWVEEDLQIQWEDIIPKVDSYSDADVIHGDDNENGAVCINSVLPDDVLEQVLAHLPIAAIIKVAFVCRKWCEILHSASFIRHKLSSSPQLPWYFMYSCNGTTHGHFFDPMMWKWSKFDFPLVENPNWILASSSGLVCLLDNDNRRKLHVCNPVIRCCRTLVEPPAAEIPDYCAHSISMDRASLGYVVTVVRSRQDRGGQGDWELSINVYSSESRTWTSLVDITSQAWRCGFDSVISKGVLYFAVYRSLVIGVQPRCGVLPYDLAAQSCDLNVEAHVISPPCSLACMRLLNLNDEVVLVGGVEKPRRPGVVRGICVWILRGREWEKVSQMPNRFIPGFGELDDVFSCSGFDKLIYIHTYDSPALLMFDMVSKEWKWTRKSPAVKRFPLQMYYGICFEPRLDVIP